MKKIIYFLGIALIVSSLSACFKMSVAANKKNGAPTTYILVRHAEKKSNDRDADLNSKGFTRARSLANMLRDVDIDAIYSSDYKRTLQTVSFVSDNERSSVKIYDPKNLKALIAEVEDRYAGKTVLIVGHSNTTPQLANLLVGTKYNSFDEWDYDNFFVIESYGEGKGKALWLKY